MIHVAVQHKIQESGKTEIKNTEKIRQCTLDNLAEEQWIWAGMADEVMRCRWGDGWGHSGDGNEMIAGQKGVTGSEMTEELVICHEKIKELAGVVIDHSS